MNGNLRRTLAAATAALIASGMTQGNDAFDPLLDGGAMCGPPSGGQPAVLRALDSRQDRDGAVPARAAEARDERSPGALSEPRHAALARRARRSGRAQAWFDQGMRLSFAFNHAEAQRAFREAQKLDPECALCYWGEALVLGPNINVPMMPEANEPALAALAKAVELREGRAAARPRADRGACKRATRPIRKRNVAKLDAAYAEAMGKVAKRIPDDTMLTLYAEALMDTQPWDYWEAGGAKPKGNGAAIVETLETVLSATRRIPVRSTCTSTRSRPRRSPSARCPTPTASARSCPAPVTSCTCRRTSTTASACTANRSTPTGTAMAVDERYFRTSPSDPLYKSAYYPHNIHFLMVSAQMGGDGKTAIDAATKLDASIPVELVRQFAILQPVKAAPYTTHAQFSDPDDDPRAAGAARRSRDSSTRCITTPARSRTRARATPRPRRPRSTRSRASSSSADCKPFADWGVPAKEIVQTARLVAAGRLADARGDLAARRQGVRGRGLHRGHARLHRAAVLVLPGAPIARRGAACGRASSTTPRRRSASRSRACATTAGRSRARRDLQAQGRRGRREGREARLFEGVVRPRRRPRLAAL